MTHLKEQPVLRPMKVIGEQQERAFMIHAMKSTTEGTGKTVNEEKILQAAEQYVSSQREIREIRERQRTFITCWHRNQEESDAMWQIYSRRNQYMLAIKTSVERLDRALGDDSDNEIGEVNYIDYRTFSPAIGQQFWYKRRSFQHEQEIRVIIETLDSLDAAGLLEHVKLDLLIEKIVLGPDTPGWFERLVKSITLKYNQNLDICHSEMNAEPYF
jgi:restriction endonuclease